MRIYKDGVREGQLASTLGDANTYLEEAMAKPLNASLVETYSDVFSFSSATSTTQHDLWTDAADSGEYRMLLHLTVQNLDDTDAVEIGYGTWSYWGGFQLWQKLYLEPYQLLSLDYATPQGFIGVDGDYGWYWVSGGDVDVAITAQIIERDEP